MSEKPANGAWIVRFITECPDAPCSRFEVIVYIDSKSASVIDHANPAPLSEDQRAAWRARQLAASSDFEMCSPNYNTVVISDIIDGDPVWVVYLLAATTIPDVVVFGGHHRYTISRAGDEILNKEKLSRACLEIPIGEPSEVLAVTDLLHATPIEFHVFASLQHGIPI